MAKLQMLENDIVPSIKNVEFTRKMGVKYCTNCGKETSNENFICNCGKNTFIENKSLNEIIGGYINLAKDGKLKTLYHKNRGQSIVNMNEKRIIQYFLLHKHELSLDKEIIDRIYNVNT